MFVSGRYLWSRGDTQHKTTLPNHGEDHLIAWLDTGKFMLREGLASFPGSRWEPGKEAREGLGHYTVYLSFGCHWSSPINPTNTYLLLPATTLYGHVCNVLCDRCSGSGRITTTAGNRTAELRTGLLRYVTRYSLACITQDTSTDVCISESWSI